MEVNIDNQEDQKVKVQKIKRKSQRLTGIGLDLGTMFLIRSTLNDEKHIIFKTQRDAFFDVENNFMSKNIRPMVLGYLVFMTTLIAILDSSFKTVTVDEAWITLLKSILLIVIAAYFGGRSYEKSKKL